LIPIAGLPLDGRRELRLVLGGGAGYRAAGLPPQTRRWLLCVGAVVGALTVAIIVFAINGRAWPWTGFAGSGSLWSWLELLVQPLALASLIARLTTSLRAWRVWLRVLAAGSLVLAAIVFAGYHWHWRWTGFAGKQLWDWLSLLLFPIVIVLLPEWARRGEPFGARARVAGALLLAGFVVLVFGGYNWGWAWTGFTGNRFRDWLTLMIAPFLLPLSLKVVHALHSNAMAAGSGEEFVVALSIRQ
jgi:hypothetical protein